MSLSCFLHWIFDRRTSAVIRQAALLLTFALSGCTPKSSDVKGNVFIATRSGQNIRLGSVTVQIFSEERIREFVALKKVEIDGISLKAAGRTLSALKQARVLAELSGHQEKFASALEDIRYPSHKTAVMSLVAAQNKALTKLVDDPESEIKLWQIEVLNRSMEGEIRKRREAQMEQVNSMRAGLAKIDAEAGLKLLGEVRDEVSERLDRDFQEYRLKLKGQEATSPIPGATLARLDEEAKKELKDAIAERQRNGQSLAPRVFATLPSPEVTAISDSQGNFKLAVIGSKKYAVAALARREVGSSEENYFWFVWLNVKSPQTDLILTNENLFDEGGGAQVFKLPRATNLQSLARD